MGRRAAPAREVVERDAREAEVRSGALGNTERFFERPLGIRVSAGATVRLTPAEVVNDEYVKWNAELAKQDPAVRRQDRERRWSAPLPGTLS